MGASLANRYEKERVVTIKVLQGHSRAFIGSSRVPDALAPPPPLPSTPFPSHFRPSPPALYRFVQFRWSEDPKPKSTTLFGVSPEFELAMYTLCFLTPGDEDRVKIGPYMLNIKS